MTIGEIDIGVGEFRFLRDKAKNLKKRLLVPLGIRWQPRIWVKTDLLGASKPWPFTC